MERGQVGKEGWGVAGLPDGGGGGVDDIQCRGAVDKAASRVRPDCAKQEVHRLRYIQLLVVAQCSSRELYKCCRSAGKMYLKLQNHVPKKLIACFRTEHTGQIGKSGSRLHTVLKLIPDGQLSVPPLGILWHAKDFAKTPEVNADAGKTQPGFM